MSRSRVSLFALALWFCVGLALGILGVFESASAPVVALTVWTLTALVLICCWKIPAINHWVMTVDLARVISFHLTRFVGIYFLVLCRTGELSCAFARPAGIGDIAIAAGAALLLLGGAVRHGYRLTILIWNALGLLDIVLVVFRALRVGLNDWAGMAALRILPLMLLPTFLVPLIIASHVVIWMRLRKPTHRASGV